MVAQSNIYFRDKSGKSNDPPIFAPGKKNEPISSRIKIRLYSGIKLTTN